MVNVTVITDVQGDEPDVLFSVQHEPLIIRTHTLEEHARVIAPECGWSHEIIQGKVDKICRHLLDHCVVEVYLGEHWIGSTEI